jgi:hypothetical protein
MPNIILYPPIAFVIYLVLVGVIAGLGNLLSGTTVKASAMKTSTYASGESAPKGGAATVLHLGVLVLASGEVTGTMGIYLAGLALVLVVLILG